MKYFLLSMLLAIAGNAQIMKQSGPSQQSNTDATINNLDVSTSLDVDGPAGTAGGSFSVDADTTETVFNDGSQDKDLRVESDGNENGIFFEGSSGNLGIGGDATPGALLDVANSTLTVADTGAITAKSQPAGRVYLTSTQNLANNVEQTLYWDAVDFEQSDVFDVAADSSSFKVATGYAGVYQIGCNLRWTGDATGRRGVEIMVNGVIRHVNFVSPGHSDIFEQQAVTILNLTGNQTISCRGFQTSGGDLAIRDDGSIDMSASSFWFVKLW